MSGGLVALLDDIAALARAAAASLDDVAAGAAKASAKAAGVVVDDAAVAPQYLHGASPARELPMIKKIAIGSIRNKLLFILPVALLLSQFIPWLLTPLLMLGGTYLCYEGAHKIWGKIRGHSPEKGTAAVDGGPKSEDEIVRGAITTDFILSAEIMVISLNEVADEPFVTRAMILIVVAVLITVLVYGAVALLVKMDDIGLHLHKTRDGAMARFGEGLVNFMPKVLTFITIVGTAAMLWVGGHIILVGMNDLGFSPIYNFVHHLETLVPAGFLAWCVNTICSLILGFIWGSIVLGIVHLLPFGKKDHADDADHHTPAPATPSIGEGSHAAGEHPGEGVTSDR